MSEPFRILVVCTGNICRSPFVEAYLRQSLVQAGLSHEVEVASAGIFAHERASASPLAIQAALVYGCDLREFQSQSVTEDLLEDQHLILTLDETHDDYLLEYFPAVATKIRPLGAYVRPNPIRNVPDPIGEDLSYFRMVYQTIANGIEGLMERWSETKHRFYRNQRLTFAIGGDHRGFELKNQIQAYLSRLGHTVIDMGCSDSCSCDHPEFAFLVGEQVGTHQVDIGLLFCGSGHGMLISVNKITGIRGVLPMNPAHAKVAREHNNANVLCFPADFMRPVDVEPILDAFLNAHFLGGKYQRRINMISRVERYRDREQIPV